MSIRNISEHTQHTSGKIIDFPDADSRSAANELGESRLFLPMDCTVEKALLYVSKQRGIPVSGLKLEGRLAEIPEIEEILEHRKHPIIGARKTALQKAEKNLGRQLDPEELLKVSRVMEEYEGRMVDFLIELEQVVAKNGVPDKIADLYSNIKYGQAEVWGELSARQSPLTFSVLSKTVGTIYSREKRVVGVGFHLGEGEARRSVVHTDIYTRPLASGNEPRRGSATVITTGHEGMELIVLLPGVDQGPIPNAGLLRIWDERPGEDLTIPLGSGFEI